MTAIDHKIKTSAERPPLDLVPLCALIGPSRAFQHGGIKYEIGNYLRALDNAATCNRYGGAALRHLSGMQGLDGVYSKPDALDDESGLPHIDHLIATLLMLRSILIDSGRLPADPGQSRFVRDTARPLANVLADRELADLADLAGLAARESAPVGAPKATPDTHDLAASGRASLEPTEAERLAMVQFAVRAVYGEPEVTSDSWWQRHPLGSPERVQAVEEHRAATVSRAEMARNHAGEP